MTAPATSHLTGGVLAVQFGAFIGTEEVSTFDASAFGIGRQEAVSMGEYYLPL